MGLFRQYIVPIRTAEFALAAACALTALGLGSDPVLLGVALAAGWALATLGTLATDFRPRWKMVCAFVIAIFFGAEGGLLRWHSKSPTNQDSNNQQLILDKLSKIQGGLPTSSPWVASPQMNLINFSFITHPPHKTLLLLNTMRNDEQDNMLVIDQLDHALFSDHLLSKSEEDQQLNPMVGHVIDGSEQFNKEVRSHSTYSTSVPLTTNFAEPLSTVAKDKKLLVYGFEVSLLQFRNHLYVREICSLLPAIAMNTDIMFQCRYHSTVTHMAVRQSDGSYRLLN
jgi:hypothetical protein